MNLAAALCFAALVLLMLSEVVARDRGFPVRGLNIAAGTAAVSLTTLLILIVLA